MKNMLARLGRPVALALTASSPRILMYHRFGHRDEWRRTAQDCLDAHLKYLKTYFNVIRLTDLARTLKDGRTLEKNTVVLTIDDGYADFAQIVASLLVKYQLPATVFIVSDFADQKIWLWPDAIHYLVTQAPDGFYTIEHDGKKLNLDLHSTDTRNREWGRLADRVLPESTTSKWELIHACEQQFCVTLPTTPVPAYRAMNWKEIRALDSLIDIGSHTKTHQILSAIKNPAELTDEIEGSKRQIEEHTGRVVTTFCYPNGQPHDFDDLTIKEIRRSGYECAVLGHGGFVRANATNLFELPRLNVPDSLHRYKNTLSGLTQIRENLVR